MTRSGRVASILFIASMSLLFAVLLLGAGCSSPPPTKSSGASPQEGTTQSKNASSADGLSAKEAVALAYKALAAERKSAAKLAFVGRWSEYCKDKSPLNVEEDSGIRADGRQAHWVVIFADPASSADVFFVQDGQAELVGSGVTTMYGPDDLFPLEGWVDSTEIQFRTTQPVGLELKSGHFFDGTDSELASHSVLWLAETSFWHFDVYDGETGQYIKSRP